MSNSNDKLLWKLYDAVHGWEVFGLLDEFVVKFGDYYNSALVNFGGYSDFTSSKRIERVANEFNIYKEMRRRHLNVNG